MSVLVCGAGPTGLVMAIELARRGIDVRIVDAREKPSPLSKAAVLWRRSLEVLHASVPVDSFIRHGRPVKGIQFEDDGSVIEAIRFGENTGLFPHGILLPQNRTEFILNHALEKLGARVERKKEVQSFSVC
ncbi:MAG: FAD-dependent monooxygenase, partial [Pirellulales bacterium]